MAIGLMLGVSLSTRQAVFAKGEEDFRIEDGVLTGYVGEDTFVSIPAEVKVIGEGAFAGKNMITSVELPEQLLEIRYNAFGDCTALKDVTIPDSVIKVGPGAFKGCTSLQFVEIGKGVTSWGSGVFNDCTSLSYLILDEQNRYLTYYDGALYNGNMSFLYQVLPGREGDNYVTPNEVKKMDTYAFYNMQNVKNIKISGQISEVPTYSLGHMGSVENVILSDQVTQIAEKAVISNDMLKQILIPESVTDIDKKAITKCDNVKILTTKDSVADTYGKEEKIPVIYEAELPTDFNDSNPSGQPKPDTRRKITITTEIEQLPETEEASEESEDEQETLDRAEEPVESIDDVEDPDVKGQTRIVNQSAVLLLNNQSMHVYFNDGNREDNENVEIEESEETEQVSEEEPGEVETIKVTTTIEPEKEQETKEKSEKESQKDTQSQETVISQRKYYKDENLHDFEFPQGVTRIERLAFAKSGLKQIDIPDTVKTIEYGAFYQCKDLEKVNIPDTVTDINTKAFAETPWLDTWMKGERGTGDYLIVGDHILLAYRGNSDTVEIPEGVKVIAAEAFSGNENIVYLDIPDSVTRINADAFRNCKNLKKVTGAKGVKTLIRGAFYGTGISETDLTAS